MSETSNAEISGAASSPRASEAVNSDEALKALQEVLHASAKKAVFTIGGKIDSTSQGVFPITIRWNPGDASNNTGRMVSLPVSEDTVLQSSFCQLVKECEPATFGKGDKDILDEEYRKAGKMDTENFSTNFTPYEYGVVDMIVQTLAYSRVKSKTNYRGIRAQLYKLNVYSGPAGKFKAHVDTPRSELQMGSLVVCLPHPHQGGQLAVRHQGREVIYDWGPECDSQVQWAAFFSDCEHEVLEVTEGHRVTLTYNLFWTLHGPASMSENFDAIDQKSLVFYSAFDKLVRCADFLPKGGTVGFICTHAYPHSARASHDHLPNNLKGIDMLVYQTFKCFDEDAMFSAMLDPRYIDRELSSSYLAGRDRRLQYLEINAEGYDDPDPGEVYYRRNVTWINSTPGQKVHREPAAVFLTYGNEAGLGIYYSNAVITAEIIPFSERQ
ncbi:hypothetical protein RJZ56_007376 [Blastomyces dermatitidis]